MYFFFIYLLGMGWQGEGSGIGEGSGGTEGYRGTGYNPNFEHADEYPPVQDQLNQPPQPRVDLSKFFVGYVCLQMLWMISTIFSKLTFVYVYLQMLWITKKNALTIAPRLSVGYTR